MVYRAKFVPTVFASRQFINHGHIRVNGKKVNIASYMVRDGDVIEVKQKSRELPLVLEAMASTERDVPDFLNVNFDKLTCTYRAWSVLLDSQDVPYPVHMEPNLVIEYYSR